jgi:outer membrane protein TolC
VIPSLVALLLAAPITLDEVRSGARDNLEALKAELELAKAGQGVRSARAAIYPQVALTAQTGFTATSTQVPTLLNGSAQNNDVPPALRGNYQLGLSVAQLLYDGGRWWTQISQAGAQQDAARGQLDEQRLVSQFEAERRFFELLRAQQALQVLERTVERSATQLDRARALFEAGRGQKRDALDAEVNLGNDQIGVLRQRQQLVSAQLDLSTWLALPAQALEAVAPGSLEGLPLPGPLLPDALEQAKRSRPLLKALGDQRRVSELALSLARAPYLPRVTATAAYNRQAIGADPFFTEPGKQHAFVAGLKLDWDVFNGFATDAAVEKAQSELRAAELSQAQAERELAAEIRRTTTALDTQLEIAVLAGNNRALAEASLKLAEERFGAGAGSTLEVRDAQLKLTQTQLTQVQVRIEVEIARAALNRTIGATP